MTDLKKLHEKAVAAGVAAATAQNARLGPESCRGFDCGFAWVVAPKVKLSTRLGKEMAALGFQKIWSPAKGVYLWYSAFSVPMTQSVSVHEAAARAYAETMRASGIEFYVGSRLD